MSILFRSRDVGEQRSTVDLSRVASWVSHTATGSTFVDQDSAMRHDAVWSCITKKSMDVAMYPVDVYRSQGDVKVKVEPEPQIIAAPSSAVDALDWRYQVMVSWLQAGNAWGLVTKTTGDFRYPLRIELLNDSQVSRIPDGRGNLELWVDGKRRDLWPLGDLWHKPAFTVPGSFLGLSPIAYHRVTIGLGLDAEKFGAEFFPTGGPSWIFRTQGDPGQEKAKDIKQRIMDVMRGSRDPLILPASVEAQQITVNPDDSQFLDSQRYTVEQICRIFDEDPTDHASSGGGSTLTYANRTDNDIARVRRRQFWVVKLQNALTEMLPRPQFVRLNTNASLMMTPKERWELHDLRLKNKTQSINGALRIEDEKPFPGGEYDEPGIPGGQAPTPTEGGAE